MIVLALSADGGGDGCSGSTCAGGVSGGRRSKTCDSCSGATTLSGAAAQRELPRWQRWPARTRGKRR